MMMMMMMYHHHHHHQQNVPVCIYYCCCLIDDASTGPSTQPNSTLIFYHGQQQLTTTDTSICTSSAVCTPFLFFVFFLFLSFFFRCDSSLRPPRVVCVMWHAEVLCSSRCFSFSFSFLFFFSFFPPLPLPTFHCYESPTTGYWLLHRFFIFFIVVVTQTHTDHVITQHNTTRWVISTTSNTHTQNTVLCVSSLLSSICTIYHAAVPFPRLYTPDT